MKKESLKGTGQFWLVFGFLRVFMPNFLFGFLELGLVKRLPVGG
jgi:hypothetical protein